VGIANLLQPTNVHAIGTDAGLSIQNTATATFDVSGTPQTTVLSNTVLTLVDELLDSVVVDDIGGPIAVGTPEAGSVLQYTITNNGNGSEEYKIIADVAIAEGGFDPTLIQIYLETNAVPGLQTGGDTPYVSGVSNPTLAEDESLTVYVVSDIPSGLSQGDDGEVQLRAVSATIEANAATDDPNDPAWPVPGVSYAGQGDGGGDAVVGTSNDPSNLLNRTTATYEVSDAVVSITKSTITVVDPFLGTTLVPGSIITYQLLVTVAGSGSADSLVISDPLPVELEYQPGTLTVDGVAEDDDFAPAGTDNSGFVSATTTIVVDQGSVVGGSPVITITYDAAIR
jgi:uncharacterized repeat protein (TIGR01451 family)